MCASATAGTPAASAAARAPPSMKSATTRSAGERRSSADTASAQAGAQSVARASAGAPRNGPGTQPHTSPRVGGVASNGCGAGSGKGTAPAPAPARRRRRSGLTGRRERRMPGPAITRTAWPRAASSASTGRISGMLPPPWNTAARTRAKGGRPAAPVPGSGISGARCGWSQLDWSCRSLLGEPGTIRLV